MQLSCKVGRLGLKPGHDLVCVFTRRAGSWPRGIAMASFSSYADAWRARVIGARALRRPDADQVGVVASSVCAVHCAAGAILMGASGAAPILQDRRVELLFAGLAIGIAIAALLRAHRRHGSGKPGLVGALGIVALGIARLAPIQMEVLETAISISGGALLAVAHLLNLRELRCASTCCADANSRGPSAVRLGQRRLVSDPGGRQSDARRRFATCGARPDQASIVAKVTRTRSD